MYIFIVNSQMFALKYEVIGYAVQPFPEMEKRSGNNCDGVGKMIKKVNYPIYKFVFDY